MMNQENKMDNSICQKFAKKWHELTVRKKLLLIVRAQALGATLIFLTLLAIALGKWVSGNVFTLDMESLGISVEDMFILQQLLFLWQLFLWQLLPDCAKSTVVRRGDYSRVCLYVAQQESPGIHAGENVNKHDKSGE